MEGFTGRDLRRAFVAATDSLERYRDSLNALNVFPVPDGDTGTNMLLTMRSALEKCPQSPDASAGEVLSGLAEGAFWGARGNSGVILSQLFKGLSEARRDSQNDANPWLVRGLQLATEAAYQSVVNPVEGTMLSVIKASSNATDNATQSSSTGGGEAETPDLWETAFNAAVEALYATPSQLPILREAGVVDAGGMGVVVILGAAFCSLTGRDPELVHQAIESCCVEPVNLTSAAQIADHEGLSSEFLDATLEANWGYCIQFVIDGRNIDSPEIDSQNIASPNIDTPEPATNLSAETVRDGLGAELARSAVIISDGRYLKVHVHASDPGPALSYGASLGQLDGISVENMGLQNSHVVASHRATTNTGAQIAVVAVVQGEGLGRLFRDAGGSGIIDGGQTMNPSVAQILAQATAMPAAAVILLPNNANVLAAANQAAAGDSRLHVVPSTTVPQGVAALLAFSQEESLDHNLQAMSLVLADVTSMEVTQAVRSTSLGGVTVDAGQYIGMIEGEMAASSETPEGALESVLDRTVKSSGQVVTIYRGADAAPDAVLGLISGLEERFPGIQVDLVDGGQPQYHYLASVE